MKTFPIILLFGILVTYTSFGQLKSAQNPKVTKEYEKATKATSQVLSSVWIENMIRASNLSAIGTPTDQHLKIRYTGNNLEKADPLYIVDGKTITGNNLDLAKINPSDIESIDVMHKGQPVLAMFGEKGANGVVLITTKKK
jgi:TonB-dependent SusC/RagA subfamily outer membrane receptor